MPTTQPAVGTGIHTPVMQNRFIVRVEATPQDFTAQTIAFAMNFAKKQLLLIVEQSVTAATKEHVVIQDMIDNPNRKITFDIVDGNFDPIDTIIFNDCKVEDHQIEFNYASPMAAMHEVILTYDTVIMGNGAGTNAYNAAMSIVGRP